MSEPSGFAAKLAQCREKKGLSQYALAKLTGLSKQAIFRLEDGQTEPTWRTVQLLALALGVDCRAFSDPGLELPEVEAARPVGRPKKTPDAEAPKKTSRKKT
jgi:transcriptional regulator with XRE-family HTH domain